ncbi:interferon alpha-inducible 27 2A isoform X1 [Paramuricea clavata]|uniref:Interferon alpha-inducible 27 2A isoform X1 n=1 Tax=Paramuricea clavata TaxID=317549 RepID=A0A6S7IDI7_PARCT|nr:interferon alpha-inducible 27 2A isoform X1 [Paramuricea clavata]
MKAFERFALVVCVCLILNGNVASAWLGAIIGGVGAVVAAPAVLTAAGFTGAGITAGSLGAYMMSALAPTAAGGVVATLQSVGAAGLGYAGSAVVGAVGAAVGAAADE